MSIAFFWNFNISKIYENLYFLQPKPFPTSESGFRGSRGPDRGLKFSYERLTMGNLLSQKRKLEQKIEKRKKKKEKKKRKLFHF